jgi:hypothetical protein
MVDALSHRAWGELQDSVAVARVQAPQRHTGALSDVAGEVARGAQTTCFLYGAPKNHDHYGLSIFCMDKR